MTTPNATATQSFDYTVISTIIRSEKPNKPLEATPTANQNQLNRITGYLPDGTKVIIAQRPGKGGIDFNKLLGGKVFAVAADGFSPVFEKDEKTKKPTTTQKTVDGLPLYSASGFYLLSNKDYPALNMFEASTRLLNVGNTVLLITTEQHAQRAMHTIEAHTAKAQWEDLITNMTTALGDENNLVAQHDEATNKRRNRTITRTKEEAEDAGEQYEGVSFTEQAVCEKDGNPFLSYRWKSASGATGEGVILREAEKVDEESDSGLAIPVYFGAEGAIDEWRTSPEFAALKFEIKGGRKVKFAFVQGNTMRTSVSFRRKVENVLAAQADKAQFGDAVYIHAALKDWTKGLVCVLVTMHPNFPAKDYDDLYYVASVRQAEVGMNKKDGGGWFPPAGIVYKLAA